MNLLKKFLKQYSWRLPVHEDHGIGVFDGLKEVENQKIWLSITLKR
jgi:transcription-repair coupling factor (superfamily II helicase)